MRKTSWNAALLLACISLLLIGASAQAKESYLSPQAVVASKDGKTLYVAGATAEQITVVNAENGTVLDAIPLDAKPSDLALSPCGCCLFVTTGGPDGKVQFVDIKKAAVVATVAVGHTPFAPVVHAGTNRLYVCNRFDNNVSIIDLAAKTEIGRVEAQREPVAAAVTPDGQFLFVANLVPRGASNGNYVAAQVTVIHTGSMKVCREITLPNGSTDLHGIAMSPDGKFAYVTHLLSRYQLPTTQLERGWMNTNALSIIDVTKWELLNTVLLDDVDLGAANPWGVAVKPCEKNPGGAFICVTHAGTHELSVIDVKGLHEKLAKIAAGEKVSDASNSPEDVPNDLSFLVGLRRRLPLTGNGPRGLAIVGTKVYTAEYFTDTVGVVDICPENRPDAKSLALGPERALTVVRKGEMYFHDATLCFQHWQSCASCHPDARIDGLNWDLLNDGMGNPKQTKSMLLAHKTPPSMVSGVRGGAEAAVRAGFRNIQFTVRPEEESVAVDEYLKSLEPVQSPYLVRGNLSAAAERGKKIFTEAECSTCHSGLYFTDMEKYKVDKAEGKEMLQGLDTPTLIEVWRTAPYLFDGRAATIQDVLTKHNVEDLHGATSKLTKAQIDDLAAYVLSN